MSEILHPIQVEDMDEVITLAKKSYPEKIRDGVVASLTLQKNLMQAGIVGDTQQFKVSEEGQIVGVCGLYKHWDKDPNDVIWGDWFFVDPAKRGSTLAYRMGKELISQAKQSGYNRIYVDTTDHNSNYFNVTPFLLRYGFKEVARIPNYHDDSVDKIHLVLELTTNKPPKL